MDRTDYRCNLEYRTQIRTAMAVAATKFLQGEKTGIEAARELVPFAEVADVEPSLWEPMRVFIGINSETDALPVGDVRALWDKKSLENEDRKIAAAERRWRQAAIAAAGNLLSLLEANC